MPNTHHVQNLEQKLVQFILRGGLIVSIILMITGLFLKNDSIIFYGIYTMALTPVVRVFILLGVWIYEKDWKYVFVAATVILTLVLSLFVKH